jgi:CheY-like chemotaxis protein
MSHPRVLLVEDDDDIREVIAEALERRGFRTRAVEDGRQALAYLRDAADKPSLILLDLTMPKMSGWEFMQVQATDPTIAGIPVVVLSAVGNLDGIRNGEKQDDEKQKGARTWAGVLTKPVSLENLIETVKRFC